MSPQLLFWIPAVLRLVLAWPERESSVSSSVPSSDWSRRCWRGRDDDRPSHYLLRLSTWLDDSGQSRLPDGWGAWTDVYARLYRMRRDDEKNQAELTEWLARFRQAMQPAAGWRGDHGRRAVPRMVQPGRQRTWA
jgi:two-component system phosphate regulon sensor histidine kinase PhoR